MKQRLGAVLMVLLGTALALGGLSTGQSGAVGVVGSFCQVPVLKVHRTANPNPCPTGTITFAEVTDLSAAPDTNPPEAWTITLTSDNCTTPQGQAVDETVTVSDSGNATTDPLELYGDTDHTIVCTYLYSETPVVGYTTAYAPDSPQSIPDAGGQSNSGLKVTVTNTADAAPTPTTSSSSASATQSSAPAPSSSAPSSGATSRAGGGSSPAATTEAPSIGATLSASSSPALANTGPKSSVRLSLWLGLALVAGGLVLLFAGRRPKGARHTD